MRSCKICFCYVDFHKFCWWLLYTDNFTHCKCTAEWTFITWTCLINLYKVKTWTLQDFRRCPVSLLVSTPFHGNPHHERLMTSHERKETSFMLCINESHTVYSFGFDFLCTALYLGNLSVLLCDPMVPSLSWLCGGLPKHFTWVHCCLSSGLREPPSKNYNNYMSRLANTLPEFSTTI